MENHNDICREWPTLWKFIHPIAILLNRSLTKTFWKYEKFQEIDFEYLWEFWKRWIILDVDECIAPHHWDILPENLEIIKKIIAKWWKIIIFSNMKKNWRYAELEKLWIKVITSKYPKPDPKWFRACLAKLWIKKDFVIMIWDNFITDWWCRYLDIDFIKLKAIKPSNKEKIYSRWFQKASRKYAEMIAEVFHWESIVKKTIKGYRKAKNIIKDNKITKKLGI